MDTAHLAHLLRSLAKTPSRRGVARALAGFALAGPLVPLLGHVDADAKRHNKKKRRRRKKKQKQNQPFCAGKNICTDGEGANCGDSELGPCYCRSTMSGTPFCAIDAPLANCELCLEGEACVDFCGGVFYCVKPCPNPL